MYLHATHQQHIVESTKDEPSESRIEFLGEGDFEDENEEHSGDERDGVHPTSLQTHRQQHQCVHTNLREQVSFRFVDESVELTRANKTRLMATRHSRPPVSTRVAQTYIN